MLASNRIMKQEAIAKSAFIRHVFHEMRTPLHILSSYLNSFTPSAEDLDEMRHHTGKTILFYTITNNFITSRIKF